MRDKTTGTMKTLVYGGGSVGLGIASCLLRSRAEVDIIARDNTVKALKENGLVRRGIFGEFYARPEKFGCYESLEEVQQATYDYVLVCTKSFDSQAAAEDIQSRFATDTPIIVLFQNGWGNAGVFADCFDAKKVFNARVITGFTRPLPNEVVITVHADAIHIGSLFGADRCEVDPLCKAIAQGGIPCESTDTIEKDLWAKMLYNCALNPLGAVLNVPYGALAKHDSSRFIMDHIVKEIYDVLSASGYRTHWGKPEDFLTVFYNKLVPDTAEHKSSTLQDIGAKKKTEIDALNGAVIRLAEEYRVDAPFNNAVYHVIKFMESATGPTR